VAARAPVGNGADQVKRQLILGPPGTGKTTTLLGIVEDCLARGYAPEEIAFVSFTRKAATEAIERAVKRFPQHNRAAFRYFRTLHSLGREMQHDRRDVMQLDNWREMAELCDIPFSGRYDSDEGIAVGQEIGDRYYFHLNLARARRIDWQSHFNSIPAEQIWRDKLKRHEFQTFVDQLSRYKDTHGLIEFSDMIDLAIGHPLKGCKIAIVDEAQDLSRAQWELVRSAFSDVEELYIAGDDDQAIYRWSGADIETFLTLPGEKRVLERSWRLSLPVWEYANRISSRIGARYDKVWHAGDHEGSVQMATAPHQVPVAATEGSWLILVRNIYLMPRFVKPLTNGGIPHIARGRSSINEKHVNAILAWQALVRGEAITGDKARALYVHLRGNIDVARGFKSAAFEDRPYTPQQMIDDCGLKADLSKPWFDTLQIPHEKASFYRRALARGVTLTGEPRVRVETIHGVKGGEADSVILYDEIAPRVAAGMQSFPDDEHRVFYVGATRAKRNLWVVRSQGGMTYSLPKC
jgi:superfamily I DNA/RNA helicase